MPSLHNQGASHPHIPDLIDYKCILCGRDCKGKLVTIVFTRKKPYDNITRDFVCDQCKSKLPTPKTRLATEKEAGLYMERWMDGRFGKSNKRLNLTP